MRNPRLLLLLAALTSPIWLASHASATCANPSNAIEAENCLPGTPQSQWDVSGAGDTTIQGFTTDISVNRGQTVSFKISTPATGYHLDIYRMGYYGGMGARLVTTVQPSATLPQNQPACLTDSATALMDCGNWSVSATWTVPSDAVSGIYFARAIRNDTGGASHIVFVVRSDSSTSDILFKTSDTSWQAYNDYGGSNLYSGGPGPQGGAYKVSYNRPFHTRVYEFYSWVFDAEYPMVRFLEANGYDVSYFSSLDADRFGSLILQHKAMFSVGHDEYWSGTERANVENARAAGVHLAFFTGNGIFWKTRWENSIDGSGTPYRTLVCYKETHANRVTDPLDPSIWTGTWRDPRFSPPADGGRPENALAGTIFMVNGPVSPALEMQVPQADGLLRFWRNTSVASLAPGAVYTTNTQMLGFEWDVDADNGFRPAGLFDVSTATYNISGNYLLDYGSTYGTGTATHSATLYRYPAGSKSALVFGAGTTQWPWALDGNHDGGGTVPDLNIQQATVNLFADMGLQPASLQGGLITASASSDAAPPASSITSPVAGSTVQAGTLITVAGTASDSGGGLVAGVEVSTDGGGTWHPAVGRGPWSYTWSPQVTGSVTLRSRAVDDSGNLETPSIGVTVTVAGHQCPCSIWGSGATPGTLDSGDGGSVELGVKFTADSDGFISGIRYYKSPANSGTHIGNLWTSSGSLLASATFSNESTSGWQEVDFPSPIPVIANTTYVASYFAPRGHYSVDDTYFDAAYDNPPLHALADGADPNGVYNYSSSSTFPTSNYLSSNYWVDVVFTTQSAGGGNPFVASVNPGNGSVSVSTTTPITVTFSEAMDASTINSGTIQVTNPSGVVVSATISYSSSTHTATLLPSTALGYSTTYAAVVRGGNSGVKDPAGLSMASDFAWTFTTAVAPPPPGVCPCSVWSSSTVPAVVDGADGTAGEYGFRFRSDLAGTVTGIRFYKSLTNTGTHIGNLWSNSGSLLASATFIGESGSGWVQVNFSSPVSIQANTTYVASYFAPQGHYSFSDSYFGVSVDNSPLHALADGTDGANGVYNYGVSSAFPSSTYRSSNYWVDVVFVPESSTTPPSVTAVKPLTGTSGNGLGTAITATFSSPLTAASVNGSTFYLTDASHNPVPAAVTYASASVTATLTPTTELAPLTTYTATLKGGTGGITDFSNNVMTADYSWSFTTGAAPPSTGPGGPILVIASTLNPYTQYYSEILSTEGLNEFTVADMATVTDTLLSGYDIVLLGDMALTSSQATMLTNWVSGGGRLIAMRPDKQLASMLGLAATAATLDNGYILVNTSSAPGAGIVGQSIQYHGTADLYNLSGATSLATLYSGASTATSSPAVSLITVGAGQAAAFTYDLARSVAYTRQGNPAWSGQARDGQDGPIRPDDLFFGAASFDPQPDWVNLDKVAIPQADEQQRLLANLILQMELAKKPLPRFWYFPSGFKAVVVMTGDDHGSYYSGSSTIPRFDDFIAASPAGCSVADWQCIRATSYLFPNTIASNPLSDIQAALYASEGFEVSLHGDSNPTCSNWTASPLDSFYTSELAAFAAQFPSVASPQTHRMHCIGWSDFDSQPKTELSHGIRLDTSYYYWPAAWIGDRPGMFTGSGMPMRFTDASGNMLDIYQAATQMTDESGQSYPLHIDTLLDNATGATGYYGAFVANMHNDGGTYPGPGANEIVASAQARGIPVVSSLQMLQWLDGRNSSTFSGLNWSGNVLAFSINPGVNSRNLQAMVPTSSATGTLTGITLNGVPVTYSTQTIKGMQYAFFNAAAGAYQVTYTGGTSTPTLSSISLSPTAVLGGTTSTGTVTLSSVAPLGGALVVLTSGNTGLASVPSTVPIPSGSSSANFSVSTNVVSSATVVPVSATYGTTLSANLTLNPPDAPVTIASITVSPGSVLGGNSGTATVTLTAAAPLGGAFVTLSGSDLAAQVPSNVTVQAGSLTATVTITTNPVVASTQVVITGTYGTAQTTTLTINPPTLTSVVLSPTSLTGGSPSSGTVTLNGAAPAVGAVVTLSSDNAAAQTPTSVTVAGGATTAVFSVNTSPVGSSTPANITATFGVSRSAVLTVNPPVLASLTLAQTSVTGGTSVTGTVTLNAAAPASGTLVTLSSSQVGAAQTPVNVTVLAGLTSATFNVTTSPVASATAVTITGTYGVAQSATLTVSPPTLSSLTLSPTSITGKSNSTATVVLSGAAPTGGSVVTLSSSNTGAAQVPVNVTVLAGANTATFTVTTSAVSSSTAVTVTATFGVAKTSTLTVNPPAVSSVSLNPTSVTGRTSSTGTVTLNAAAPTGGSVVTLSSSNTGAAQVGSSVTVLAGATTATFTVTTSAVSATSSVTITATYGGSATATLTVNPPSVSAVSLSPTSVTGGSNSTGTVTLNAAAPTGGSVVTLSSGSTAAAQVPASVTVLAGATTASFTVTSSGVANTTSVTITATFGVAKTATLTVNPPVLSSLTINPSTVVGGNSSTGTVTLGSVAPSAGLVVTLSSSKTSAATVPATVTVPGGALTTTFTISTSGQSSSTSSSISATFNGTTKSKTLTVNAATLASVTLNPTSVKGGNSSTGTLSLNGTAPSGGGTAFVWSSSSIAQVPFTVTIPAGASSVTFTVTTSSVSRTSSATISGFYGSNTRTATLTVTR